MYCPKCNNEMELMFNLYHCYYCDKVSRPKQTSNKEASRKKIGNVKFYYEPNDIFSYQVQNLDNSNKSINIDTRWKFSKDQIKLFISHLYHYRPGFTFLLTDQISKCQIEYCINEHKYHKYLEMRSINYLHSCTHWAFNKNHIEQIAKFFEKFI